jgi:hypothetical protein
MNLTDTGAEHAANTDVRRLLDAGYSITFALPPAAYATGDGPLYMASVTSSFGSHWLGAGETPAAALRSVWPLGDGPGHGGCGHCDGMGCNRPGCPTCAAWLDGEHVTGTCGVCGYADPDEPEPYCTSCGGSVGIFLGHGDGWHHYRGDGTAASPNELFDAGHAPVIGWRGPETVAPGGAR